MNWREIMKKEPSAIEKDYNWIVNNGYTGINLQEFSSRVTRDWIDIKDSNFDSSMNDIRKGVVEKMMIEKNNT
jgi:hypothetical protein